MPELSGLLTQIRADHPDVSFAEGTHFSWQAGTNHISYQNDSINSISAIFSLLHELGHAILKHKNYKYDIELLQLEVAAWDTARTLAERYQVELDEDYIQDCLDTYRDWLHLRATCPTCYGRSLQTSISQYRCFNCQTQWQVSRSRMCRPYRLQKSQVEA